MTTAVADPPPPKHTEPVQRPRIAKLLRVLAIPIIIFWVLVAVVTNVFLPSLDDVTADNAGPLVARDAPSAQAAIHQGNDFDESNYTSVAVLMLETENRKLGEQDHQYYNEVVRRLLDDTKHVASVQDLWGKPVTMSGSQSADAEATTLTIRPTGDLGSPRRTSRSRRSATSWRRYRNRTACLPISPGPHHWRPIRCTPRIRAWSS